MNTMGSMALQNLDQVELICNLTNDNPLSDFVDPSAACVVDANLARKAGILPFGWDRGVFCVAIARPLTSLGESLLENLGPVRLYRADAIDIVLAQLHVYRHKPNEPSKRFGEIALEDHRITPETLTQALKVQGEAGGKLGQICVSLNALTAWDVTEVLSRQTGIPTVNLLREGPEHAMDPLLHSVWKLMDEKTWRYYEMVPIGVTHEEIVVAIENPFVGDGRAHLSYLAGKRVRGVLTGRRDIEHVLAMHYRHEELMRSRAQLLEQNPEDSAVKTITKTQLVWTAGLVLSLVALMVWHLTTTLSLISSIFVILYAVLVGYRLWIIRKGTMENNEVVITDQELAQLDDSTLPMYTILIPARDEASVLPVLTQALERLDYPKDRLDVKLLLEEDDESTIAAARAAHLPGFIDIVIVPVGEPRTKPKACNFGLQRARGEYVTIFDAEDLPEPSQLKKALIAFRRGDDKLACVQAKLSYFNAEQNLLTRWFTAEYGSWFDLFLPALHASKLPIPLGGTSNHFRTEVLRNLGAWDPFNVTEDADLGIRLTKAGYRTAVMDSVTYEEANSEFVNWIRQRSRWIKGYLQTWLVHMRHPRVLRQKLGWRGFWGFQMSILGTPLMFILNPLYWFITSLWFMTHWQLIPQLFPPGIYYFGMLNLLAGNFVFTYLNAVGAAKQGNWKLVPYTLLTPIYWSMMSLASWKALIQLITRPSHWEKTDHGLVDWQSVHSEAISGAFIKTRSQSA